MDPKKQAELFYKSLATVDAASCKLLARGARIQRGRVVALKRKIQELELKQAPATEIAKLQAEVARRTTLAGTFDALDVVIDKAIQQRAVLDKDKFK
jgi:hypothetical protein